MLQTPIKQEAPKMERRLSNTSESSIEPMDLGRTPKKQSTTTTSTAANSASADSALIRSHNNDSEYDSDEYDHRHQHQQQHHHHHHHHRRHSSNGGQSKQIVQIESATDNPNSLRKKFRISSSTPNRNLNRHINNNNNNNHTNNYATKIEANTNTNSTNKPAAEERTSNESGFVDASSHSLNLTSSRNAANCTTSSSSSASSTTSSSAASSAGSSPAAVSSPESGIGERDDIKYICPICEVVSATPHEFTNHIRCHNYSSADSENFTCQICSKVLSSASSLDRHVLVHTGERPFNCKYCHLTFTTNGNMHRHMRTHKQHPQTHSHRNSSNGNSPKTSNGNNVTTLSPSAGGGGGVGNGNSGESYESDSTDSSSAVSHSSSAVNNNNNNNNTIHTHTFKRKSSDSLDDTGLAKRRIRTTINNNNILSELDEEEMRGAKFACPVCNRDDFESMPILGTHMDREHPDIPAKCRHCDVVFKTHKQLNGHRCMGVGGGLHHDFVEFASEKFPLIAKSLCEQSMRTPVEREIAESEGGGEPQDFSVRKPRAVSESSAHDDADVSRRAMFFAHLDLQNKCGDGDAVKSEQDSLNYSHDESKDFADIQSILNVTSSSANNFLRNFDKCVSNAGSTYSLDRDEEEAQDAFTSEFRKMKLRGEFPCKLCAAVFPNLRALKGHNRIHLSAAGAGPFRCNMCPYSIHDKAALIRHMRTHNGDRPYECAVCNYAFTTKANCERHLRNRHGKTTRDDVKRAIIYHPSEDSSCDDPVKKLQMFSSPSPDDFDADEMLLEPIMAPKDRSTPVSHLKEMLQADSKVGVVKIQVKSLEKLMDARPPPMDGKDVSASAVRPIDLSMDVLDLSKKAAKVEVQPTAKPTPPPPTPDVSQQFLLAQQQFLSETLPKMDPAHYYQLSQFYRNFVCPPLHPAFFLQNSFLQPNAGLGELKFPPLINPAMFAAAAATTNGAPPPAPPPPPPPSTASPLPTMAKSAEPTQQVPIPAQLMPKTPQMSIPAAPQPHSHHPSSMMASNHHQTGPVKMVIKNGVLMPKQKQRRYRTERPFACEHCSARFTLRSNMERHIKQQHPQYWAQRQRSGHHIMRGRAPMPHLSPASSQMPPSHMAGTGQSPMSVISDQVKYAILAQQLKARNDSDILHQALSQGSRALQMPPATTTLTPEADDDPKLVIDEDDDDGDVDNDDEDEGDDEEDEAEDLTKEQPANEAAKKVAETILEQAIKAGSNNTANESLKMANNLIARAESVRKFLKEVASSPFKDEQSDLVSVSKLVDNATNPMSFNNYFRPSDVANHMEQSDEEGLVASGSAESESNHSGADEDAPLSGNPHLEPKKKSAYSLAPNRVSCPYCQRMFPWSSSLRRHILTHTGQKPFKCSHCPLLFTTKSNCDRHLLRKHGNVDSAVSLYMPIEDIPESLPLPKSLEEIERQQMRPQPQVAVAAPPAPAAMKPSDHHALSVSASDLPFKCHLCDSSFAERMACLDHIKIHHAQEFALLLSKGAIDTEADASQVHSTEDDEKRDGCGVGGVGNGGKYPDYANRKVICAFCVRRFWSTEDLRRHMRTHSGERPFQCEICLRKFTLKHSMLRHMKKHSSGGGNSNSQPSMINSGSDMSDDEQSPPSASLLLANSLRNHKIQELLSRKQEWLKENIGGYRPRHQYVEEAHLPHIPHPLAANTTDLIGNLLGISDQGILNKLLSSADEAAKLLGVDK